MQIKYTKPRFGTPFIIPDEIGECEIAFDSKLHFMDGNYPTRYGPSKNFLSH